jgi:hypothetical protein
MHLRQMTAYGIALRETLMFEKCSHLVEQTDIKQVQHQADP